MNMDDVFEREGEKFEEKLLDIKMEFILDGWSHRIASRSYGLRKEIDEYDKFVRMVQAQAEEAEQAMKNDPTEKFKTKGE